MSMVATTKEHFDRVNDHVWDGERQDDDPRRIDTAFDKDNKAVAGYIQHGNQGFTIARYDERMTPPLYEVHVDYYSI